MGVWSGARDLQAPYGSLSSSLHPSLCLVMKGVPTRSHVVSSRPGVLHGCLGPPRGAGGATFPTPTHTCCPLGGISLCTGLGGSGVLWGLRGLAPTVGWGLTPAVLGPGEWRSERRRPRLRTWAQEDPHPLTAYVRPTGSGFQRDSRSLESQQGKSHLLT